MILASGSVSQTLLLKHVKAEVASGIVFFLTVSVKFFPLKVGFVLVCLATDDASFFDQFSRLTICEDIYLMLALYFCCRIGCLGWHAMKNVSRCLLPLQAKVNTVVASWWCPFSGFTGLIIFMLSNPVHQPVKIFV